MTSGKAYHFPHIFVTDGRLSTIWGTSNSELLPGVRTNPPPDFRRSFVHSMAEDAASSREASRNSEASNAMRQASSTHSQYKASVSPLSSRIWRTWWLRERVAVARCSLGRPSSPALLRSMEPNSQNRIPRSRKVRLLANAETGREIHRELDRDNHHSDRLVPRSGYSIP